jgi:uncharacterized membrane protein YdbT with pleckstrin-like domain
LAIMVLGAAVALMGTAILPPGLPPELTQTIARIDPRAVQWGGLALAGLALLQLLIRWVATRSDRLMITDSELLWSHGLLNKEYTEIDLDSVRTVKVAQSLFQRLVGAGDVSVFTSGDLPELAIRGLPQPNRIRELVKGKPAG